MKFIAQEERMSLNMTLDYNTYEMAVIFVLDSSIRADDELQNDLFLVQSVAEQWI